MNSVSPTTMPAANAPSAGEMPMRSASAMVTTINTTAAAVKASRPRREMAAKMRGTMTRARRMSSTTPAMAMSTRCITTPAGGAFLFPIEKAGTSSISGMTARS
jgi:hypothetical protein